MLGSLEVDWVRVSAELTPTGYALICVCLGGSGHFGPNSRDAMGSHGQFDSTREFKRGKTRSHAAVARNHEGMSIRLSCTMFVYCV